MMKWVGLPKSTEEELEREVVSMVIRVIEFRKRNDRLEARWTVSTTSNPEHVLGSFKGSEVALCVSGWCLGSAHKAAQEIAQFHGMELEEPTTENDSAIYAYTDRPPTMEERKQLHKDPLTLTQKLVFRKIRSFVGKHNKGPTKTELMKILGHRSMKSTKGILDILERKNWIFVRGRGQRIELI